MAYSTPRTWATDEIVTAAHMNQEVRDNLDAALPDEVEAIDWTPTLEASSSDPSTSAVTGRRWRVGPLQFVLARFVLSTAGSGEYFVTLPTTASGISANTGAGLGQAIGTFHARDITPAWMLQGNVLLKTVDAVVFHASSFEGVAGGGAESGILQHNGPRAWGSGDVFSFMAFYPVA
jgi:hypothetical protein